MAITPAPSVRARARLLILCSAIAVVAVLAGFAAGRHSATDAYVHKVAKIVEAQNTNRSLYQELGPRVANEGTLRAMAQMYGVPPGDREAILRRMQTVPWFPAHRPVPFVGKLARPTVGENLQENVYGFRDARAGYADKPAGTVRVFLTGGSFAWGSGASSQTQTIAALLEARLNASAPPDTRFEVINAAFPAWSSTHEKLLIQQRIVDLRPDVILMVSGGNDVHWALNGRDVRWLYDYADDNYLELLNELYRQSGHPEWVVAAPEASPPMTCEEVSRVTARNVTEAAFAAAEVGAGLVFALQPNVISTAKRLSAREREMVSHQNVLFWNECYQNLRERLAGLESPNYRWLDLSRAYAEVDDNTEIFIDRAHVGDLGNRLLADALAEGVDWRLPIRR